MELVKMILLLVKFGIFLYLIKLFYMSWQLTLNKYLVRNKFTVFVGTFDLSGWWWLLLILLKVLYDWHELLDDLTSHMLLALFSWSQIFLCNIYLVFWQSMLCLLWLCIWMCFISISVCRSCMIFCILTFFCVLTFQSICSLQARLDGQEATLLCSFHRSLPAAHENEARSWSCPSELHLFC